MLTEAARWRARVGVIGSYAKALVMTADRIPVAGETLVGRDYRQTFGGKGSDMAVQAARLGASVAFVGVVGEDVTDEGRGRG
jgi:ribokinase